MRSLTIPPDIQKYWDSKPDIDRFVAEARRDYQNLLKGSPDVSIVIPAYNEEKTIARTLSSICRNITTYSVEVIVVNNNSKDNTAKLAEKCGVTCLTEVHQGIVFARNCGLAHARGRFVINADADTIYPLDWVQHLIEPLEKNINAAVTYGRFSFLPEKRTKRLTYFLYESIADISRTLNKYLKDEAVNVYGCCSAFRREQALQVDGYNHPPGATEDGYLALKLRNGGFGKLFHVKKALVWTTDRRIHIDGGLWRGSLKRLLKIVGVRK